MKVIQAIPLAENLQHSLVRSAQYTILCAQASSPEKRIRLLVERLKATSETNAPQYTCFLLNSCIEALSVTDSSTGTLAPDFVEWIVESVLHEAKKHAKSWPYFLQWVCALIHYFCIDDSGTLCVFFELGAPHLALSALQTFPNFHFVVLAGTTLLTHFTMFEVEGSVPALTHALHTYLEDIPVCLRAVEALAGFTWYDKEFPDRYVGACEKFVESNGVEALTHALQRHLSPSSQGEPERCATEDHPETSPLSETEDPTTGSVCRFPDMLLYIACITANVMNAGVLDDVVLSNPSPLPSTSTTSSSSPGGTNFSPVLVSDADTGVVASEGSGRTDKVEKEKRTTGEGRFEVDDFVRGGMPGAGGSTEEGSGRREKFDLSTCKIVELLAAWLSPRFQLSDAFSIQVLQVLSNVPHSPFVDWDCISTLFLSSSTESVALWCLHFLTSVAMNVKEAKGNIYETGCVPRVLEVMRTYPTNGSIQEVACSLLSYLSFDSEVITECITKGEGIRLVLDAMKAFPTNELLLLAACAALSGLTFHNQAGQVEMMEYQGIGLILDALRIGRRTRLLENGCLAIGTMCWNTELKHEVVRLGGVEVLMKILEEHYTHPGVVKNTFRALAQISFNCEKYRMELSTNGVIPLLIRGMEQHPQHDKVQLQGCVALSYLSWTNQGNAAQITAHRGYQAVIHAMQNHPHQHEVQEHAARALANISQVSQEDAMPALAHIVKAMKRHERCAEVQEEACRAMVTLSLVSPANKDTLYELGGAEVVVSAMKHFPRHHLVQQEACNALAHLAYEHASLNRAVTELHGIDLLLSAMRTHVENAKVQLNACGGLSALAFDNPVAQRQIFELGGVQCVIRAMENFERVRMLELGCSALGTLAWNTEIKEDVAVEAVPEILKAMRVHELNPLLQKSTCRAISQFAFNSEKNRHLLAESGAIPLVVRAIRNHLTMEKLVVHAVKALTYLCWENVQVAEQIMHENIEDVLQEVVNHYANSTRISSEAVHLSKILFRKTAGSLSPATRVVSPPSSSPPMSAIASFTSSPYQSGGGGNGGALGGRRSLRRGGGGGGGGVPYGSCPTPNLFYPHRSPGGGTRGFSTSPSSSTNGGEHRSPHHSPGGGGGGGDAGDTFSLSSSLPRETDELGSGGGGSKGNQNSNGGFPYPPFSSQRWTGAGSRGGGGGGRGGGGRRCGYTGLGSSLTSSGPSGSGTPHKEGESGTRQRGGGLLGKGAGNGQGMHFDSTPLEGSFSSSFSSYPRSPGGEHQGGSSESGALKDAGSAAAASSSSSSWVRPGGEGSQGHSGSSHHVDPRRSSTGARSNTPSSFSAPSSKVSRRGRGRGGGGGGWNREDLWDDPAPETFYGNREVGEENWRQCEMERQS